MYCPEPNTIHYDKAQKSAYVAVDRCKGCEICVEICDHISKHHAIKMVAIDELEGGFELNRYGMPEPDGGKKAVVA
ncbi:MAG: pyruvate ferredoxin oxidoreductase [Nitrospirota bacterium]|jgi:ferredoxin